VDLSHAVSISTLGTVGIAGATLIVLGLALVMSWADRRFTAQALELQGKKLQQSEAYLSEAQRLSRTGSFGWKTSSGEIVWSEETFRIFEVDRATKPTLELILRIVAHAERDNSSELKFVGAVMDITKRKRAEEALRASEQVARGQVEALTYSLDVLATAPEPEKFIGQMLSSIGRLFDAQSVALWLLDETGDSVVLRAWAEGQNFRKVDADHPFMKNPLLWKDDPGLQEAFLCGAPVACEDVEHDRHISEALRQYFLSRGTKKFLRIPTLVGGKVKGFIGIRHEARTPYRPEEIELAQALAHQVMLAIQLTELAEQSRKTAILAERNRMARDIHDTLAQGFIGVILQLDAVADAICRSERKEAENYLQRASELARRSLNEARRSVHALRPEALEHANFWDALKGIIKNTTAASPIHIGQEALTNTLKYAHADNFETQLTCDAKELRLEFKDDGDGFKLDDQHDGFGLVGMRERVQQMGGELRIATERSKGTTITVLLPNSMS
jgi:signal transduction histidine kinase